MFGGKGVTAQTMFVADYVCLSPFQVENQEELSFLQSNVNSLKTQIKDIVPNAFLSFLPSKAARWNGPFIGTTSSDINESFREKYCTEGSDLHLLFDDLLDGISVKSRKDGATPPKTTWEECVGQFNNLLDSFPIEHSIMFRIEVIWIIPRTFSVCIKDCMSLYGALLRAVEWHHGSIKIVVQDKETRSVIDEWADELRADVFCGRLQWKSLEKSCLWRGNLTILQQVGVTKEKHPVSSSDVEIADCSLHMDKWGLGIQNQLKGYPQCTLGSLEVLQIVARSDLPLFRFTGEKLILTFPNKCCVNANKVFQMLKQWNGDFGLLISLKLLNTCKHKANTTYNNWREEISRFNDKTHSLRKATTGDAEDGPDFLLYALPPEEDDIHSEVLSLDLWVIQTLPIHCPFLSHMVNPDTRLSMAEAPPNDTFMDSLLCELPKVVKRNGVWQQSEEAFSYSPVDVSTLLRSWELNGGLPSPMSCPELLAVMNRECRESCKLKRLTTPDMTFNSKVIPRQITDQDVDNIQAADILPHFNRDGTPLESLDLSPLPALQDTEILCHWSLPQDVSEISKMSLWELSSSTYHGVNYCTDKREKEDARLVKIQQHCILDEAGSVCNSASLETAEKIAKKRRDLKSRIEAAEQDRDVFKSTSEIKQKSTSLPSNVSRLPLKHVNKGNSSIAMLTPAKVIPPIISKSESKVSYAGKVARKRTRSVQSSQLKERSNKENEDSTIRSVPSAKMRKAVSRPLQESTCNTVPALQGSGTKRSESTCNTVPAQPMLQGSGTKRSESTCNTVPAQPMLQGSGTKRSESTFNTEPAQPMLQGSGTKRSEKHRKKLEYFVRLALKNNDLSSKHPCHKGCCNRLYNISKSFLKDLTSSKNLGEEMRSITELNAKQVIDFELKKCGSFPRVGGQ